MTEPKETKFVRATKIYEHFFVESMTNNKPISRKIVVNSFVTDLGMSHSGASTYYQKCKNSK